MAEITATMVRELRDKTDAPMMECKKALVDAGGDATKAEEFLRIRLGNKASKAATRTAAEGVVAIYVAPDARTGAIVEVNCETDFVAKNEDFLKFASSLSELVAKRNPLDLAALRTLATIRGVASLPAWLGEHFWLRWDTVGTWRPAGIQKRSGTQPTRKGSRSGGFNEPRSDASE